MCSLVYKGFLFLLFLIGAANIFRYRVVPYLKGWVGEVKVFQQYYWWCCAIYDCRMVIGTAIVFVCQSSIAFHQFHTAVRTLFFPFLFLYHFLLCLTGSLLLPSVVNGDLSDVFMCVFRWRKRQHFS